MQVLEPFCSPRGSCASLTFDDFAVNSTNSVPRHGFEAKREKESPGAEFYLENPTPGTDI